MHHLISVLMKIFKATVYSITGRIIKGLIKYNEVREYNYASICFFHNHNLIFSRDTAFIGTQCSTGMFDSRIVKVWFRGKSPCDWKKEKILTDAFAIISILKSWTGRKKARFHARRWTRVHREMNLEPWDFLYPLIIYHLEQCKQEIKPISLIIGKICPACTQIRPVQMKWYAILKGSIDLWNRDYSGLYIGTPQ